MQAWARMADIRLQQDRRRRPRLPLLRRPQGAERLQRPEDDASRDREGVEQGAQRRPEADRRDRQLQQARLVEVQGGPRVVRPRSEPSAQGQGGPGLPVLLGSQGARRLQRPGHHPSRHSGDVAPAHEQALEARRRAGRKPQARMVARRVRPRLPDGRPRQGEGQAGLLPVLLREKEAREADKARLALGPSARKEWGRRRCLLPIGVILRILGWTAMRGGYGGCIVFDGWIYVCVDVDTKNRPIGKMSQWDDFLSDLKAAFRSWFIANEGGHEL